MATVITEFSPPTYHGNAKYPWWQWFDGRVWQLKRGEDFTCPPHSFRCTAYTAARPAGLRLRVQIDYVNGVIELQAIKKGKVGDGD